MRHSHHRFPTAATNRRSLVSSSSTVGGSCKANIAAGWSWFWLFGGYGEHKDLDNRGRRVRRKRLEAILFIAREPLNARKLAQLADLKNGIEARALIRRLNQHYRRAGRSFRVERIAGGYQLLTKPEFSGWLRRLNNQSQSLGLSSPALETLAVVAYQQPILRAEVESVRGVSCGELLRQLMDRNLVRISGRSEELGRPFLYSTTRPFLSMFGLNSLDDLPQSEASIEAASDEHLDPIVVESEPRTVANPSQENEEVTLTEWHQDGVEEIEDAENGSQSVVLEIEDEENYAYADDDDDEEDGLPADGFDGLDNNFDDDDDEDDDDEYDDSEENEWQEVERDDDDDDDDDDDEYDDEWSDEDDVEWTDDDDDDDDDEDWD